METLTSPHSCFQFAPKRLSGRCSCSAMILRGSAKNCQRGFIIVSTRGGGQFGDSGGGGFTAVRMCERHAESDQVEVEGGEQVITVTCSPPRGKRNPNRETQQRIQRRNADQHGKWGAGELMRLMEAGGGGRGRKKKTGNDQHKNNRTQEQNRRQIVSQKHWI